MSSETPLRDVSPHPVETSASIAIRVRDISKCYQIYDRPEDRLVFERREGVRDGRCSGVLHQAKENMIIL